MRIVALVLALWSIPAFADSAPPPPSSETMAAARDMVAAANIKDRMHSLMPRIGEAAVKEMQKEFDHSEVPDALRAQLGAAMQSYMASVDTAFTPGVIDQMAAVYARHFSVEDLRHLTAIMRDPVMVKYQQQQPDIVSDLMPVLIAAMRPQQEAFRARMKQIVGDWVRAHPDDKAKLPKSMTS